MAVKEKALSTSVFSQWSANFLVAYVVPLQVKSFSVAGTFAFYTACLVACLGLVYCAVPETRGLELEEMGRLFGEDGSDGLPELSAPLTPPDFGPRLGVRPGSSACSLSALGQLGRGRAQTMPDMAVPGGSELRERFLSDVPRRQLTAARINSRVVVGRGGFVRLDSY
mmetsp:Transcript_88275/g.236786  ORF Transcript_88275/g.236786 Transcript_88275/m.236786 type:complete len:168 (-) Transcript_88275:7-510(-)